MAGVVRLLGITLKTTRMGKCWTLSVRPRQAEGQAVSSPVTLLCMGILRVHSPALVRPAAGRHVRPGSGSSCTDHANSRVRMTAVECPQAA